MGDIAIVVSERTARHIESLPLEINTDGKLRALLESEYRRRLSLYSLTNRVLKKKYGMTFDEFESQRIVERRGYSWEVESDAIEWDLAMSGTRTMQRKLAELIE